MSDPKHKGSICNGTGDKRDATDFYETPSGFTAELLRREKFHHKIWECAAGAGAISKVLHNFGYQVLSTDLEPRSPLVSKADFFEMEARGYDIVTNPPFKLLIPFAVRGFKLCHRKMALCMYISGLNSSSRYQSIWSKFPVSRIMLAGRYQQINSTRGLISSQCSHIWVVFDKAHQGKPTFEWFPDVVYSC